MGKSRRLRRPESPEWNPIYAGRRRFVSCLDKHRDFDTCRSCHEIIDPPGFALESFDPIGGWRERFRSIGGGDPVDQRRRRQEGALSNWPGCRCILSVAKWREHLTAIREFRDHLASQQDVLAKAFAIKLLTFATGREMGFSDREEIERIVAQSKSQGYGIRDLMHLVVQSEIFRRK